MTDTDTIKVKTPFVKGILNKVIKKALKKKLGCDVDVSIGEITIKNDGKIVFLCVDLAAQCPTENIPKILKNVGIL